MAMIGSVLPDVVKFGILFDYIGVDVWDYFQPLHLPVGSIILAGIVSLFFEDRKTVFLFIVLGVLTHFFLDLLLYHLNGGMHLFYPFSWQTFSLNLVPNDDFNITIIALLVALSVYIIFKLLDNRKKRLELF
jgi:membrane-bound metal-dependent hydrolase YbcI (DUF457 family)